MISLQQARTALLALTPFVSLNQHRVLANLCHSSEERDYFRNLVVELAERIQQMPDNTTRKDGPATVYLHYFLGGAHWYITEKDGGCADDAPEDKGKQLQAFGLADLFRDGGELGCISVQELIENNAELDLHWNPKPLEQVQNRHAA
jgi:hypothetical protein